MKLFDKMKDLVLGSEEADDFSNVPEEEYEEAPVQQSTRRDPVESFEPVQNYEPRRP